MLILEVRPLRGLLLVARFARKVFDRQITHTQKECSFIYIDKEKLETVPRIKLCVKELEPIPNTEAVTYMTINTFDVFYRKL